MGCVCVCGYEVGRPRRAHVSIEHFGERGVALSDFFTDNDLTTDVNSYDGSLMEKVKMIEALSDEEKKTVFSIVDAFVGKKKLKDALSGVLNDVK